MYYVDCGCASHDIWAGFQYEIEAQMYFEALECYNRILYFHEDNEQSFKTIRKMEGGQEMIH